MRKIYEMYKLRMPQLCSIQETEFNFFKKIFWDWVSIKASEQQHSPMHMFAVD